MDNALPDSLKPPVGKRPFAPWVWIPLLVGGGSLGFILLTLCFSKLEVLAWPAVVATVATLIYFFTQCIARLFEKSWKAALFAFLRLMGLVILGFLTVQAMMMMVFFGPSEDHFADKLTIPSGIEVAVPDEDTSDATDEANAKKPDELQADVRRALAGPGSDVTEFSPDMPSLRRAATDHPKLFRDYIEASPDWDVFAEQGNHFAARRWSYGGEPRDTMNGYISEFGGAGGFQTRCLICLDCKQWNRYEVQYVQEGSTPVKPVMSHGNNLHESRVMIECGGVWVEIFEQSGTPERRATKATITALEQEFVKFEQNPDATLADVRARSHELARNLASKDGQPLHLLNGMQPGMYGALYSLNPGEPGSVYLKAFEVTRGTPLSVDSLKAASETRMAWSPQPAERFGAKTGFTIYEGDWGKPYAARFEIWFIPDADKTERKLAERIFKIEGWQR